MRSRSVSWMVRLSVAGLLAALLMPVQPASAAAEPSIYRYRPGVITDPAAPEAARGLTVLVSGSPSAVPNARWLLSDSGGGVILEAPATLSAAPNDNSSAIFDPTEENGGEVLPDGTYGLQLEATDGSGSAVSNRISIELAFAPPPAVFPSDGPVSDVVPSAVDGVRADAQATVRMPDGLGFGATVPDGVFTIRDAAGAVVRSESVMAWCPDGRDGAFCLREENIDTEGEYSWQWDGRVDGTLQPAGRYTVSARLPDRFGRLVDVDLGSFWIRHLATVTGIRKWTAASYASYSRTGRCSSVSRPGPHRWPGSVGLLSLSRCRSTAGIDDLAAQTFRLTVDADYLDRLLSWRLDGYGGGVHPGMSATLLGLTSAGWQHSATLGRSVGWHNGTPRTTRLGLWSADSDGDRRLVVDAQARATDGSRYSVKYVRTVLTYRAWVR